VQPGEVSRRTVLIGGFAELGCPIDTPPEAPSPKPGRDTEVSSQQDPDQGGHTSGAGYTGAMVPMSVEGGGDLGFGPLPDTVPETFEAPGSGRQPPLTEGGEPALRATSVLPEVEGSLSTALNSASIVDEHRSLMGAVIEKIQSAESGLNESCLSLIKGFEVCF